MNILTGCFFLIGRDRATKGDHGSDIPLEKVKQFVNGEML